MSPMSCPTTRTRSSLRDFVSSWISTAMFFLSYPEAGLPEPPAPRKSGKDDVGKVGRHRVDGVPRVPCLGISAQHDHRPPVPADGITQPYAVDLGKPLGEPGERVRGPSGPGHNLLVLSGRCQAREGTR